MLLLDLLRNEPLKEDDINKLKKVIFLIIISIILFIKTLVE